MKKRQTNFELLRFIAMYFIVVHHLLVSSFNLKVCYAGSILNNIDLIAASLDLFFLVGVNIFFLLSGYFSIKLRTKKVILIILNLYLISGLIRLLGVVCGALAFDEFLKQLLLPFISYWFISVYILLMLVSPYINDLVDNIEDKKFVKMLITCACLFCIIGWWGDFGSLGVGKGYSLVHACVMYVTGRYIYVRKITLDSHRCFWVIMTMWILNVFMLICFYHFDMKVYFIQRIFAYNSLVNIIISVCIFMIVKNMKLSSSIANRYVLRWSPYILAVYYIHSSSWMTIYRNIPIEMFDGNMKYLFTFIWAGFVLQLCLMLGKVVSKCSEKVLDKLSTMVGDRIDKILNTALDSIC